MLNDSDVADESYRLRLPDLLTPFFNDGCCCDPGSVVQECRARHGLSQDFQSLGTSIARDSKVASVEVVDTDYCPCASTSAQCPQISISTIRGNTMGNLGIFMTRVSPPISGRINLILREDSLAVHLHRLVAHAESLRRNLEHKRVGEHSASSRQN